MLFRSNDTATTEIYTVEHTLSLHDALPIAPADAAMRTPSNPPAVVFDCAGHPGAVTQAVNLVAPAGRIVLVALPGADVALPQTALVMKEASVISARDYTRAEFDEAVVEIGRAHV